MGLRMVRPETVKLDLSDGSWILVKKRLTAGETRKVQARMIKTMNAGEKVSIDPMQVGRSQAIEYLLDWSNTESPIRDRSADDIGRALDGLDADDFADVMKAIVEHEKAQEAEREAEKNGKDGKSSSPVTSPSAA